VNQEVTDDRLHYLEYKILDLEARTKERNLLFSGITESVGENPMEKVLLLLSDKLGFPAETVFIVEARRIGRVIHPNASNRRPVRQRDILVTFGDVKSVNDILSRCRGLAGTPYGISRDFPREIKEARTQLWGEFKQLRSTHGRDRVKLVFPAAIKVDGHTVADKFPYWYATLTSNGPPDYNDIKEKRLHQRLKDHDAPSFDKFIAPPADHNEAAEAPATRSQPIKARPLVASNPCANAPSDAIDTGTLSSNTLLAEANESEFETEVDSDASESLIPSSVTSIKASTRGRPRTRQPARSTPRSRGTGKRPGRGRSRPAEKPIHSQPVSVPMGDDDPPHTIPNTQ